MTITMTSSAFTEGGMIPNKYSANGENLSPPLSWTNVPENAKTLALIVDDPDAPSKVWVHWVLWNLPATVTGLPEGVPTKPELDNGARQGMNDSKKTGYSGPRPPSGTHSYYFKLYALDTTLNLGSDTTKETLLKAMDGHIVGQGQLMGKYSHQ
ncbi:MAG: YbhB/YbcL family Raf kinase inhibitor-like protein [Armatimonadota bacterium]